MDIIGLFQVIGGYEMVIDYQWELYIGLYQWELWV